MVRLQATTIHPHTQTAFHGFSGSSGLPGTHEAMPLAFFVLALHEDEKRHRQTSLM